MRDDDDHIEDDTEAVEVEAERDPTELALPTDPSNNAWEEALEAPREMGRAPWGLTHRQWRFICEYFVDLNASKAAVRAGYASADAGYRLMRHPVVSAAIEWTLEREAKRYGTEPGRVLQAVSAIAYSDIYEFLEWGENGYKLKDPKKIPAHKRQVVRRIKFSEYQTKYGPRVELDIQLESTSKGLELLGKATGLFREQEADDNRGAFRKWFDAVMSGDVEPATREIECTDNADPKEGGDNNGGEEK